MGVRDYPSGDSRVGLTGGQCSSAQSRPLPPRYESIATATLAGGPLAVARCDFADGESTIPMAQDRSVPVSQARARESHSEGPCQSLDREVRTRDEAVGGIDTMVQAAAPHKYTIRMHTAAADAGNTLFEIEIIPPDVAATERRPLDLICVVDTSVSMGSPAHGPPGPPPPESGAGHVTRIDLVRHALKMTLRSLAPCDRGCIVTFDSVAKVAHALTADHDGGIAVADTLELDGCVEQWKGVHSGELWAGIQTGLDQAIAAVTPGRTTALLVLSDGEVSDKSHLIRYNTYLQRHPVAQDVIVSAIGIGRYVDSKLLSSIARVGGGLYMYEQELPRVAAAVKNNVACLSAIMESRIGLQLDASEGATICRVNGQLPSSSGIPCKDRLVTLVDMGSVQFGQPRNVTFMVEGQAGTITATLRSSQCRQSMSFNLVDAVHGTKALIAQFRDDLATALAPVEILNRFESRVKTQQNVDALMSRLKKSAPLADGNALASALLDDLVGQVADALHPKNFDQWGRHYLPSLARSHMLQQCTNSTDPGLQSYGGSIFRDVASTRTET